jgi:adenylate kinase
MVKDRLLKPDSVENGWLLDGYPRSLSQATALKELGFKPDIFILLEVNTCGYIAANISNVSSSASL